MKNLVNHTGLYPENIEYGSGNFEKGEGSFDYRYGKWRFFAENGKYVICSRLVLTKSTHFIVYFYDKDGAMYIHNVNTKSAKKAIQKMNEFLEENKIEVNE